jgi:hypothetical protein
LELLQETVSTRPLFFLCKKIIIYVPAAGHVFTLFNGPDPIRK